MVQGGSGWRGQHQHRRLPLPRAQQEAMASAETFKVNTPPKKKKKICVELELMEANIRLDKIMVSDGDIDTDITTWIPNTGSSVPRKQNTIAPLIFTSISRPYWEK
jgi:hypothetical protein